MSAMIRSTYAAHPHGAWWQMSVEARQDWRDKIERALESVGAFDALEHECDDGGE